MKLLLDIGNTCIKWAYVAEDNVADGGLTDAGQVVHRDRLAAALAELPDLLAHRPTAVAVVNVAGAVVAEQLTGVLGDAFAVAPAFMRTTEQCGEVSNGYTQWQQLGVDRWAAVIGAWQQLHSDVCVVDAGTALTIDLVRADGRHLGGIILPGLRMMDASLGVATADIADHAAGAAGPGESEWYGLATAEAVQRGAQFALCAAIDRAVARFPTGARPLALLTGGDAQQLQAWLRSPAELQPMLVLEGLRYLAAGSA